MNINIKDVNVLERLLPNQHSSKEMSLKQADAGFKNVYENRLQQNNHTASARLEKQNKMPDERVKAKLENAFEKNEAFASRIQERKNESKKSTQRDDGLQENNPYQKNAKSSVAGKDETIQALENTPDKPVATDDVSPVEKPKETPEAAKSKETEAAKETEETKATDEAKSPLTTFMQMVLKAVEEMSAKLGELKEKMKDNGTLTPEVQGIFDKLEAGITALKTSLNAVMDPTSLDTGVVPKFIKALEAIQKFDETVKDILKALPQTLKGDMTDSTSTDKTQQASVMKGVLQEIKEALKTPLTQIHTKPLFEKLEHVEGKAEKWIEQEIRKMMNAQKTENAIKGLETSNGIDQNVKDIKGETNPKGDVNPADEKKTPQTAASANSVTSVTSKAKGESSDNRVVHLEQIGTPIDKQIVKIVEKNTESQVLFKSILSQVQEGVKTTLKVSGDSSEMVMKLKPETLGDVSVKITVHKNSIIAEMTVQSQIVKEALESSLMDLKSTLRDKGFDVSQINVNVGQEHQAKEDRESGHSQRQGSRFGTKTQAIGSELPNIETVKTFIQNGRMDYFA